MQQLLTCLFDDEMADVEEKVSATGQGGETTDNLDHKPVSNMKTIE